MYLVKPHGIPRIAVSSWLLFPAVLVDAQARQCSHRVGHRRDDFSLTRWIDGPYLSSGNLW